MVKRVTVLVVVFVLLVGCEPGNNGRSAKKTASTMPQVYVTNYPLKYFAERIGAGLVDVHFPMTDDGDPAFWQPDSQAIARYQTADAIITNGATYEKWIANATLPDAKLVDSSKSFSDKFMQMAEVETHSHGPGGEHSHTGTAFTTWIDFDQAAQQAGAVKDAIVKLMPNQKEVIEKNLVALVADLKQLDEDMMAVAKLIGERPVVASHPVYEYWARRYSLNLKSVLWEPDVVPSAEAIDELKKLLDGHTAQVMIWEGTPAAESVEKLKSLGIASVVFDPCGNFPAGGHWLTTMQENISAMRTWAEIK